MHELFPEFGKFVLFVVVKSRCHGLGWCSCTPSRCSLQEVAVVILLAVLPDHVTGTEIVDQEFEKICLRRIFPYCLAVNRIPNLLSGRTWGFVDLPDDGKVRLRIHVDPVDKHANYIIQIDLGGRRILKKKENKTP